MPTIASSNAATKQELRDVCSQTVFSTLTTNSTTPAVSTLGTFKTANTTDTTITNFTGGYNGQRIFVVVNDAFTTLDFTSSNLVGNGGIDYVASSGDSFSAVYDGTTWYCQLGTTAITDSIKVGIHGDYLTVGEAITYINTISRYTVIYETGTITLTNGSYDATPSGGADFSALGEAANSNELWIYLPDVEVFIPLVGMTPNLVRDPASYGNYGQLKYRYEGTTGDKNYQLVKPNWKNILLQVGETKESTLLEWPLFTTLTGESKEGSIFRGGFSASIGSSGFFASNFKWGSIYGILDLESPEEALIVFGNYGATEMGYAENYLRNISGGKGNADRDVTYRLNTLGTHSMALDDIQNCELYAHYDVIQSIARNLVFKHNEIYINTQDTTVMIPTGLRWFSGIQAPETDLFLDIAGNNFFIEASTGAKTVNGLVLIDDAVGYLTVPPAIYGQVVDNYISARQLGTGDANGITMAPNLFGTNTGRLLVDRNTFDVVSSGGTRRDFWTHATVSPIVLGLNNVTLDASALEITGAPFRLENHGLSAAIATGATIAHGMRTTPTFISAIPTGAKTDVYVTVDATNITVNYGGGGTSTFHWKAEL